jgi:hypothetical protein
VPTIAVGVASAPLAAGGRPSLMSTVVTCSSSYLSGGDFKSYFVVGLDLGKLPEDVALRRKPDWDQV